MEIEPAFLHALKLPEESRVDFLIGYQLTRPYSHPILFESILKTWIHYSTELQYENSTRFKNGGTNEYSFSYYKESGGVLNGDFTLMDIYEFGDSLHEYHKWIKKSRRN